MEQSRNEERFELKQDLFRLKEKIGIYNSLLQEKDNLTKQLQEVNEKINKTKEEIIASEQKIRIRTNKT